MLKRPGVGPISISIFGPASAINSMPAANTVANWLERYAQPAVLDLYEQATDTKAGS